MIKMRLHLFLALAGLALATAPAFAQNGRNFDVKTMNFDLWCQEQAHLPADRCDKRTVEDEKTFEAFRGQIEQYEIPYLQQKNGDARLDADILHNDPVDRSVTQDTQTRGQSSSQTPGPPIHPQ